MNKIEEEIEHHLERLEEIESELNTLNHKKFELESRRKYLYEKINKLDEQRMDAIPAN